MTLAFQDQENLDEANYVPLTERLEILAHQHPKHDVAYCCELL